MDPFAPKLDTRNRLLRAAIDQIEEHGLASLTVRGVAAAAEANIAAVNYHFGSKEELVAAALDGSLRNMLEDTDVYLGRMAAEPAGALCDLLAYYLEGFRRYPRTTKAHLHDAFSRDEYGGAFPAVFTSVAQRLVTALRQSVRGLDSRTATRRVTAALSGVLFASLFAGLFEPLGALSTPADRLAYPKMLAGQALAPVTSSRARARRPPP